MKLHFTLIALLAMTALSQTAVADIKLPRPAGQAPLMIVGAYDVSTAPASILNNALISKNNPQHQLCWRLENLNPNANYQVVEHFRSPNATKFVDKDAQHNGRSPNGTYHRITRTMTTDMDGATQKCWEFGGDDPNGQYEIRIEADNLKFPVRYFFLGD